MNVTEQEVNLSFSHAFDGKDIRGSIHFYAPANAIADRTIALRLTNGGFHIARAGLAKARYEVQVSYTVSGKDYYQALPLDLL